MSDENNVDVGDEGVDMWDALADPQNNLSTVVYYCDMSFPVGDDGTGVREVFAAVSKERAINTIYGVITHDDVTKVLGDETKDAANQLEAVKLFFEGKDERNLFLALVPVY